MFYGMFGLNQVKSEHARSTHGQEAYARQTSGEIGCQLGEHASWQESNWDDGIYNNSCGAIRILEQLANPVLHADAAEFTPGTFAGAAGLLADAAEFVPDGAPGP